MHVESLSSPLATFYHRGGLRRFIGVTYKKSTWGAGQSRVLAEVASTMNNCLHLRPVGVVIDLKGRGIY